MLKTAESVLKGHPDKICDIIADKIMMNYLKLDINARCAIEVTIKGHNVNVFGEVTVNKENNVNFNIEEIVKETIEKIGYTKESGIDIDALKIDINISKQSEEISQKVGENIGAGDQGMMYGYACLDTDEFMPAPIFYSNKLAEKIDNLREKKEIEGIYPDGKVQLTFRYEDNIPKELIYANVSVQHSEGKDLDILKEEISEKVIKKVIPTKYITENTKYYVNKNGSFVLGGPAADSGLTGRKLMVDTYGGLSKHGGGSFSGKDITKVDRTMAYFTRYLAREVVSKKMAKEVEIAVAYIIGDAKPISLEVNTFEDNKEKENIIKKYIENKYELTLEEAINILDLKKFDLSKLSVYGHFGRNLGLNI